MPRRLFPLAVVLVFAFGSGAEANLRLSEFMNVLGSVRSASRPVDEALVVAFNLADYKTEKTRTSSDGAFVLPPLKAGIYRIIAVKQGFAPAVATVVPNKRNQSVALHLEPGRQLTETERDQIWQIRRSLPSDVLRELNLVLAEVAPADPTNRFQGEMASLASVAQGAGGVAQTALGVRGTLSEGLRLNFEGRLDRTDSETGNAFRAADNADVAMTIHSGASRSYGVLSRKNSWTLTEADANKDVALESHQIEVRNKSDRLRLRYFAQENLFAGHGNNTEMFEVVGEKRIYDSASSGIGVRLRYEQEAPLTTATADAIYRAADFAASGRHQLRPGVEFGYVLRTRVAGDGHTEYAPESNARLRVADNVSLIVSGLYKLGDVQSAPYPRAMLFGSDEMTPRYRYTFGLEGGTAEKRQLIALVTIEEIDSNIRVVFDDRFGQVWDGFYLETGDRRVDLALAYRTRLGDNLIFDFVTNAGGATSTVVPGREISYLSGNVQSHIQPSGTTIEIGYRYIDQPLQERIALGAETTRLNIRMAQSLHLPMDLSVLLGVDLARSPDPLGVTGEAELQKRLLGGISFAF